MEWLVRNAASPRPGFGGQGGAGDGRQPPISVPGCPEWQHRTRSSGGESHSESPHQGGPVDEDIVSVVHLRGRVLELSSSVQKRPVKMVVDSGATGNFVSDAMVTVLGLPVQEEEELCRGQEVEENAKGEHTGPAEDLQLL